MAMSMQNAQYTQWGGQQPQQGGGPAPGSIPGCPPGLEYLTQIDSLIVHQKKECFEIFTGWEQRNRYVIQNAAGQQFYFAQEESSCFQRQCCKQNRGFILHITDNFNQEVLRIRREFKCCVGCCWCADSCSCAFVVYIETPQGQRLGMVRQSQTLCYMEYKILNEAGQDTLHLQGPCCCCVCPCCTEFEIQSLDRSQTLGGIRKRWGGMVKEMFTNADTFNVNFPLDLDVKAKATLLGAAFLIDFMFFEQQNNN